MTYVNFTGVLTTVHNDACWYAICLPLQTKQNVLYLRSLVVRTEYSWTVSSLSFDDRYFYRAATIGVVYCRKRYEQNPNIMEILYLNIGNKTTEKGKIIVQVFYTESVFSLIRRITNILCCFVCHIWVTMKTSESNVINAIPPWKIHTCL